MPGNQSGKGNSQRRNGGTEGGQHNVGGSPPPEYDPALAGGNPSPSSAGVGGGGNPSPSSAGVGGGGNPSPSSAGVGGGGNILPHWTAVMLAEQAAAEQAARELPNNMAGNIIRRGEDAVARVRQGLDHHASPETLLFFIALLTEFLLDNKRFNPAACLRIRFNMLMAEAKRLRNSLQSWHRLGLESAQHHPDFDGMLRRSLADSAHFERERAREAHKREEDRLIQQERNSARKARRAAAKEREEKEIVERKEREEHAQKEREEREKRSAEERRLAEEEEKRKRDELMSRANEAIQDLHRVDGSSDSESSEDDSDSESSEDDSDSVSSEDDSDSESSEDDEKPTAPVQDPAHKWLLHKTTVQTVSSGTVSKGGRGFNGRLSSEARKKNRKAARSTRPDSPDEGCGGFVGDDDFGGYDDFDDDCCCY